MHQEKAPGGRADMAVAVGQRGLEVTPSFRVLVSGLQR